MTIISKPEFYEKVTKDFDCSLLHNWSNNCFKALLHMCGPLAFGTAKLYAAIYLLQIIPKWKKINKTYLKHQLIAYIRSILYGLLFGFYLFSSNCIMMKLFGRLHYYTIGLVTGMCGGCSIFVESKENRILSTILFSNLCVEAIIRHLEWNRVIKRTVPSETFIFMLCSSVIMYLLKKQGNTKKFTSLWFYYPTSKTDVIESDSSENKLICEHKDYCVRYIFAGAVNYFAFGFFFNLLKKLIPRTAVFLKTPKLLVSMLLDRSNFLLGSFFGCYVGLYRGITCLLRRKYKKIDHNLHAAIAGFISGSVYCVKPSLQMLIIALTTLIQLLLLRIDKINSLQNKVPLRELLFIFCNGYLFHNRVLSHELCPKYYFNMLNVATNGLINRAISRGFNRVFFPQ